VVQGRSAMRGKELNQGDPEVVLQYSDADCFCSPSGYLKRITRYVFTQAIITLRHTASAGKSLQAVSLKRRKSIADDSDTACDRITPKASSTRKRSSNQVDEGIEGEEPVV